MKFADSQKGVYMADNENTYTQEEQAFVDSLQPEPTEPEVETEPETADVAETETAVTEEVEDSIEAAIEDIVSPEDKSNHAFAQMRVQNKELQNTINQIAGALGLDSQGMTPQEVLSSINETAIAAQAQAQKIPVEILARLNELEQNNNMFIQDRRQAAAREELNVIADKYGADRQALTDFVNALDEDGVNFLTDDVDLEAEYLKRNFNAIIEHSVQAALENEAKRTSKAQVHSSQPSDTNGGGAASPDKINTVGALDAFFNSLNS